MSYFRVVPRTPCIPGSTGSIPSRTLLKIKNMCEFQKVTFRGPHSGATGLQDR
jgi:hypothetical protein